MPEITVYSRTPRTAGGFECGGQRITLSGPIKSGGEGMIYAVKYSDGICAKVYHRNKINAELREKVKAMINNPPGENLTGELDSSHSSLISWAISALYDSNLPDAHFLGFTMPLIDTSMFREAHRYYDPDDRIKYMGGTFTWLYLLTAAFNIASVVSAIHLKGHRIGDMSASNILVARTAAVSFIDCDSFQITDAATKKTYYTKVATGDFLPPELMGVNFRTDNIDRYYSDLFALGVMIFKFLMNGFHPYQARGAGV
ncbi:MAG: protein kinase, partial [Methanomicrobium sp.]|nr:protein kinase [Methanomicrobium sp.]